MKIITLEAPLVSASIDERNGRLMVVGYTEGDQAVKLWESVFAAGHWSDFHIAERVQTAKDGGGRGKRKGA